MNITKRQRLVLGCIFFALMFGHSGVNAYTALTLFSGSYDGWTAPMSLDGIARIISVDQNGPATELRPGDEFVSINGMALQDDPKILNYSHRVPPGTSYTIVVRRQGQLREFSLKTTNFPISRWLDPSTDLLVQLIFLLTGLTIFLLKPADRQAWLLVLMLGMFPGLFNNDLPPLPMVIMLMMAVARTIGLWLLPVFCHFFLIFPDRSPLLRRFPNLERWLYWPFFLALPCFTFRRLGVIFSPHAQWAQFFQESWLLRQQWVGLLSYLIIMAYLVVGLA